MRSPASVTFLNHQRIAARSIQYKHFGEGAYDEAEQKIQELLAEKDRV